MNTVHSTTPRNQLTFAGYIMGHKMADLREQGLLGTPTYKLTNNHGTVIGLRRDSSPLLSDTPGVGSNEDYESSPARNTIGPQRGRPHSRKQRGSGAPYPSATSVGSPVDALENQTSVDSGQQRNNRSTRSVTLCQSFTSTGISL